MNYLFSQGSLRILESLSFTRTLYAFDFDGTLAPIVTEPDRARMEEKTERLFVQLSKRVPTAIISGRSVKDLRQRIPSLSSILIGNHGLECPDGERDERKMRRECADWHKRLTSKLFLEANDPGLVLEDKGLSLALHYRKSRKKKVTRSLILKHVAALRPIPRVITGKLVLNLVPESGRHKGLALQRLLSQHETPSAFYIGDDRTDEDVFSLDSPKILTVRVGMSKASEAKYFLKRQAEVNRLLSLLLKFHDIPQSR